ncbi:hypothetical protein PHMEG_00027185 [Phytophthora megakarya]|uniref:Uncharacterized protein n=1 Tax=Phytophthora megakarya TaxID=4795 RepID=A0A225V9G8_9STRA|nr:hypothetical protein PHMEG_00027185 [Phytophthora megakarya]
MTHAQKLRQKLKRWNSRLRSNPTVSSLMDGVIVTPDGNVTVSAGVLSNIASPRASFPPPSSSGELENKPHQQLSASFNATSTPLTYNVTPLSLNQARPPMIDDLGTLPPNSPVSFVLGICSHSGSTSAEAIANSDAHDILDELTTALSEEDSSENEKEITEEELGELDDGGLAG